MKKKTQAETLVGEVRGELAPIGAMIVMVESGSMEPKHLLSVAKAAKKALASIEADLTALTAILERKEAIASEWIETNYPKAHFKEQMAQLFLEGMRHAEPYIGRVYNRPVPDYGDLMTIDEWNESVSFGGFIEHDGHGYFVKDNMSTYEGDIFEDEPEDATHVIWFNK